MAEYDWGTRLDMDSSGEVIPTYSYDGSNEMSSGWGYGEGTRGGGYVADQASTVNSLLNGKPVGVGSPYGSGGYSGGSPWVSSTDIWNANVGKNSNITGGTRYGGSIPSTSGSYGGGSGTGSYNAGYVVGNTEYKQTALPAYKSTYVAPDERKISALTATGGGNALRQSVANLVNRTLSSSAALPLAVRRQQMRQLNEEIAGTYAKSMPNIRRSAANEWQGLYGRPQSEAIAHENTYNMQVWLNNEKSRLAEYMARLGAGVRSGDVQSSGNQRGVINMAFA